MVSQVAVQYSHNSVQSQFSKVTLHSSFCVAGAVFGEVGSGLFVTGAALRDILGDSRNANCCILQ